MRAGALAAEEAFAASQADYRFARLALATAIAKGWFLATESVLLGRYPAAEIETAGEQLPVPPPTPAGVPAQVLERRPDLLAALKRVRAAFLLSEEARLARLPRLTLTGAAGADSDLRDFIASIGAGLFAPLFTGGALKAQLEVANADQKVAIAAYGQAVLTAFREVEDALANEVLFVEREGFLESVVKSNEHALELARIQFEEGPAILLPAPDGPFSLQMRCYWPEPEALDPFYVPPAITKAD